MQQQNNLSEDEERKSKVGDLIPGIECNSAMDELNQLLDYIELNEKAVGFFDQNGSRSLYNKFRDGDSPERNLHHIVHFFISMHLPLMTSSKVSPASKSTAATETENQNAINKKSNLKPPSQINSYKDKIIEASKQIATKTRSRSNNASEKAKTREEQLKLFEWWSKQMQTEDDEPSNKDSLQGIVSVNLTDAKLIKMAYGDP